MFVEKFRTIHDSKVVWCEPYQYGFSITYILTYEDGRVERIVYYDKSIDRDLGKVEGGE